MAEARFEVLRTYKNFKNNIFSGEGDETKIRKYIRN